jgi:oxygen-independent coproporphyrinogen-3 oxidase
MDKLTPAIDAAKRGTGDGAFRPTAAPAPGPAERKPPGSAARRADPLGVYVHFPWCVAKCPYCDFLSVPRDPTSIPAASYADAVIAELAARRPALGDAMLGSVFFGGGTPSLWDPRELGRTLAAVLAAFPGTSPSDVEISVECNPSSLSADRARALAAAGVNRLSIGAQSLDNERLRFLGRWHDASEALASIDAALGSGVARVSADLIYGVAGQTPEQAASEASTLADLGLTHLSAYALTIEPQTRFGALARKGRLPLATEDGVADSSLAVQAALASRGFVHYEVSNYARDGHVARHNLGYWRGFDYLGLGCGAWGTLTLADGSRERYRNLPSPEAYQERALALTGSPGGRALLALASERETLSPEVQLSEALMLGLRLSEGLDAEAAAARSGALLWTTERTRTVRRLVERGQLERDASHWRIPPAARLLSDGIISQLL